MRGLKSCISLRTRTTGFGSFLLVALLLFASAANAENYTWFYNGSYPSAVAACSAVINSNGSFTYDHVVINVTGPTTARADCYSKNKSNGSVEVYGWAVRSGDGCATNTVYNSATGECEAPEEDKCADTAGASKVHESDVGPVNGGSPSGSPDPVVCDGSCQYVNSWEDQNCYMFAGTDPAKKDHFYCKFRYQGNGTSCTAGNTTTPPAGTPFDQPPTKEPIPLDPSSKNSKKCSEWTTTGDGTATRNCDTEVTYTDPGKLDCSVRGNKSCTPVSPIPQSNDNISKDTTTTVVNPDGSRTTTTVTTNTKITCKGVSPCTTTTSTTTKTDGTNADGSPGDSTTTCTGSGCKSNGTGTGNGNDASDDEGEEGEEDEPSVSGEACTASIACTGDAVQCAILRQEKLSQCNDEKYREIDSAKLKTDIQGDFSGTEFQPLVAEAANKFDFSRVINTDSRFSATCPQLPTIQFTIRGQTQTVGFDEGVGELCKYAVLLSYLMVAFAMYRAAGIITGGMN